MTRSIWKRLVSAAGLLAALGLLFAGCHGGGKARHHLTSAVPQERFPELKIVYDALLDYLDPALSYTNDGWQAMWRTYVGLITYKEITGPDGATLVPGLAQDLPQVSSDAEDYKFVLRKGLEYSNGLPVKASDFKYAIKRLFLIDSPGVGFFTDIVGADKFAQTKKGDIPGIVVNDAARTIEFKLTQPRGDFDNVLATIFAAPVPQGTPARDQSIHPIPAGPYMITSYRPNRDFTLARNPHFRPTQHILSGNPDRISVDIVQDDAVALQRVISGQADYDFHQVPIDRLASVQSKYGGRLRIAISSSTYYFFMNTRREPFDKLEVRQAVNYAIERDALVRLYGGLATPTENILPPTYPSYRKLTLYPHDVARAKQLIQQAGAQGTRVTVWGFPGQLGRPPAEYLADVLNKIGLKADLKIISGSIYFTTIGNQATKAQIGVAGWNQDYPHPLDWFDVLLNGERITQTHNNNYSNANVAAINEKIDQLKRDPTLTAGVNAEWANVDKMVMQHALWAPFVNPEFTDFFSDRVDMRCYVNHVLYRFDWYRICVK
jgi:peptide/nickel transport system substrate-binding protein